MTDTEALAGYLNARSNIYQLFSDLYCGGMGEELYGRLYIMTPHLAGMAKAMENKPLEEAANGLALVLNDLKAGEELYSKMKQAFTRLYLLGAKSLSLHESMWLSPEKEVKKEPYFLIRAYYKAFQFTRSSKIRESDESLTVMLLFLSSMSKAAMEKVEQGDYKSAEKLLKAQQSFLNDHLLKWVPALCSSSADLAKRENLIVYGEIAALLQSYVDFDKEMVADLIESLQ